MAFQGDSIFWVEVDKIVPNPYQPRREFDEAKLKELSESIRMYGILQPLTVTRKEIQGDNGAFRTEYELIAGERRLRASKLAGVEQVPVIIRSGEQTDQEKLEIAIIENLQREDLNAVDRALAFQQLSELFELTHAEVARKVGRSREYVSNTVRLLMLPEYILSSLRQGDITEGHARSLLMLKDRPEEQDVVFREILLKKISVRGTENIVRRIATDKVRKKEWLEKNSSLIEMEKELTNSLGTRVSIQKTDFGGKLTIDYFSEEDLERLLAMMKPQGKITDFHLAKTEEGEESDAVVVQKLTDATALEAVPESPIAPVIDEVIGEEQFVADAVENEVVEQVQTAATDTEPASPTEPAMGDPERYRLAETEWEYKAPEPTTEAGHEISDQGNTKKDKEDDDDSLYSIHRFSL